MAAPAVAGWNSWLSLTRPFGLLDGDHGVSKLDKIVLLHVEHFLPDFLCLCF
jgi:hypothetical protein